MTKADAAEIGGDGYRLDVENFGPRAGPGRGGAAQRKQAEAASPAASRRYCNAGQVPAGNAVSAGSPGANQPPSRTARATSIAQYSKRSGVART